MLRFVEKKSWKKNIEKCYDISEKLNECVTNSPSYRLLKDTNLIYLRKSISSSYIKSYIHSWMHGDNSISAINDHFYNKDSDLWKDKTMSLLNTECNFFNLKQCCEDTFNLENLKGNYEDEAQRLIDFKK